MASAANAVGHEPLPQGAERHGAALAGKLAAAAKQCDGRNAMIPPCACCGGPVKRLPSRKCATKRFAASSCTNFRRMPSGLSLPHPKQ